MGRLSEYVNSGTSSASNGNEYVQVSGIVEDMKMFEKMLTTDPDMERNIRKLIRQVLKEARKRLSQDARNYMDSDPRKAYRAVKHSVYKELFGGNLSILQKKKAGTTYTMQQRTSSRSGRGGNRRPFVNDNRNRLYKYMGADRGFVLRFLASGTVKRQTRYGNRGSIRQTNWFAHTAPWHMETAAEEVANSINEYVNKVTNG